MIKPLLKETFGFIFNPAKLIKMIWPWCVLYALYAFFYSCFDEEQVAYRATLKVLLISSLGVMLARGLSFGQRGKKFPFGLMELNYFFSLTFFIVFPAVGCFLGLVWIIQGLPCPSCGRAEPVYGYIFGGGFFAALMFYVMIRFLPALPSSVLLKQKTWQSAKAAWKATGPYRVAIFTGFLAVFLMVFLLTFLSAVLEALFSGVPLSSEAFWLWPESIKWVFDFVFWIFFISFVSILYKLLFPQAQKQYEEMASLIPGAAVSGQKTEEKAAESQTKEKEETAEPQKAEKSKKEKKEKRG